MEFQEVRDRISKGQRILVPMQFVKRRAAVVQKINDFVRDGEDLSFHRDRLLVAHPSGGFAHFAMDDEAVRGMEYHACGYFPTPLMLSRVRLSEGE